MAIVVDNFINNPLQTRAYALSLPFTVLGNYPGKRTMSLADASWIPFLEKYLPKDEKISWFDTHPFSYNGAFQQCTAADGSSWIHRDTTDWAAVLFLTPDAPPSSGLTLYRHRDTKAYAVTDLDGSEAEKCTANLDAWEVDCTIGNRFNRLVMFRGSKFHKASSYFGSDLVSGRLFQLFFFNTTSPPLMRWSLTCPRVLVVIPSTNRYNYLEQTLASFRKNICFGACECCGIVVIDDYPARRDRARMERLKQEYGLTVVEHAENLGLSATWRHAWDMVRETYAAADWIFHIEDDVIFETSESVDTLLKTYVESPVPITQVALARQPVYGDGDIITLMTQGFHGKEHNNFVAQSIYFLTLAALYPREIATRFPKEEHPQEHTVAQFFIKCGMVGAVLGQRNSLVRTRHIGDVSRGKKGPGFEHLPSTGDYDFRTGQPIQGQP